MFKNVGNELKVWAKIIVILLTVPSVLFGLFLIKAGIDAWYDGLWLYIAGIVVAVAGYFLARLAGIFTYAFGELITRVTSIDEMMRQEGAGVVHPEKKTAASYTKSAAKGSWECPVCGAHNSDQALFCEKCHYVK